MKTLLELLPRIERLGKREALRAWNGYRTFRWSYADLDAGIRRFAAFLDRERIGSGDRLALWADNRPEWVAIFWACLARGVELVPLDARSSRSFVERIAAQTDCRLLVHGRVPPVATGASKRFAITSLRDLPDGPRIVPVSAGGSDVAEIVFTSGTTAEPKGVIHRHRNICANLEPIQQEMDRYRKWAAPVQPIRILDLLPLSHLFGQTMGIFVPLLLGGSAVFSTDLQPLAIHRTVRRERVSVLVCVPRILDSLRAHVERRYPRSMEIPARRVGIVHRWWRHRKVHGAFGMKFWAFVVGGAVVNPETEAFWSRVGLLVIQGYGLTETSPVVAVNHPFRARQGTLGEIIPSQEVRIAADGEILVRGQSVVSDYLEGGKRLVSVVDRGGWLHTGDMGEIDEEGRLLFRGRKKDVIVTADGMNVHPEDVERELVREPGVRDAAVVAVSTGTVERVHAALILDAPDVDRRSIIETVNRRLEPHQRVQGSSVWPNAEFPQTPSTLKTQRHKVAEALAAAEAPLEGDEGSRLDSILVSLTRRRREDLTDDRRLGADLGLSSLQRIDLLASLEDRYGFELEETALADLGTVGEVRAWVSSQTARPQAASGGDRTAETRGRKGNLRPPRWARSAPVTLLRGALQRILVLPLFRYHIELSVSGLSNLGQIAPPVLFAANHSSHLDTVALAASLPGTWRTRLAPAARQQHFFPTGVTLPPHRRVLMRILYGLACGLFNAYPLSQDLGQMRDSLRYTAELVEAGYCPLVYPEGIMTPDGSLQQFQSGIGLMATRLEVPIVPVRIDGLFDVMSVHDKWPRKGSAQVSIGPAVRPVEGEDYILTAQRVEESIRHLDPSPVA